MPFLLDLGCGFFWIVTYITAIVIGFRYRTCCIPPISICMNFSWELLIVITRFQLEFTFSATFFIQLIWCLLDFVILLTWQLFRTQQRRTHIKDGMLFLCIFVIVFASTRFFDNWTFLAFFMNLIMSIEFIFSFNKDATKYSSRFIAITKLIGTLFATLLNGLMYKDQLILGIGGLCLILDIYFLMLLLSKRNLDNTLSK